MTMVMLDNVITVNGNEHIMREILELYCSLLDNDITTERDFFCECHNIITNREEQYSMKRKAFEAMVSIYDTIPEISEEFELISKTGPFKDRFARRDRNIVKAFDDGINYDAPNEAGLYFIGETHFNPHTMILYYWIKIGLSTNLRKRMKQYDTHCPMLWRIDFKTNLEFDLELEEEHYHDKLKEIAVAGCNHNEEWFLVDRETYLAMCEKGFSYFN